MSTDDPAPLRRRLGSALRARRASGAQRPHRLASTVRMPWLVGVVIFTLLSIGTLTLVGQIDTGPDTIPQALLDAQEAATSAAAQSVRRSVNEGVDDLAQAAAALELLAPSADPEPMLTGLIDVHGRYRGVHLVEQGARAVVAGAGSQIRIDDLGTKALSGVGLRDAVPAANGTLPEVNMYAEVQRTGRPVELLVGSYDATFLRFPLGVSDPGSAWLVNGDGRVLAALDGFQAFQTLDRRVLREAADRGQGGGSGALVTDGSIDRSEMVSWAPVTGEGPAGELGWSVVTARAVNSVALPEVDFRRQGILVGTLLGLATVLIFGWLWIAVYRPLLQLQGEAERVAYGDLARAVPVVRYDEIGITARAIERMRVSLIRRRVRDDAEPPA